MFLTNYLRKYIKKKTSQNGEEGVIEHILKKIYKTEDLNTVTNLQLCEIGSGDGFFLSNSYYFIKKYKFKALMVEANTECYQNSKKRFKSDDTIHENEFVNKEKSIDYFLNKHSFKKDIDFLSIDVDGQDYHLFRTMCNFRPKIILIESNMTMGAYDIIFEKENMQCGIGSSPSALYELAKSKNYRLCMQIFNNLIFIDDKYFSYLEFGEEYDEDKEIHCAFPIKSFQDHQGNVHLIHNGPWKFNKIINHFPDKDDDSGGVNQIDFLLNLNNKNISSNIFENFEIKIKKNANLLELENFRNFTRDAQKGLNSFETESHSLQNDTKYLHEIYKKIKTKDTILNVYGNKYIMYELEKVDLSKHIFIRYSHLKNINKKISLQRIIFKINSAKSDNLSILIRIEIKKDKIQNPIEFAFQDKMFRNLNFTNTSNIIENNLYMFKPIDDGVCDLCMSYMSIFNKSELSVDFVNSIEVIFLKRS
jgi:hypothetical protein